MWILELNKRTPIKNIFAYRHARNFLLEIWKRTYDIDGGHNPFVQRLAFSKQGIQRNPPDLGPEY